MKQETKTIEIYQLAEFCKVVELLLSEGWKFDFDSNERYPTSYGSFYQATLVRTEVSKDTAVPDESQEVKKSGPGRKKTVPSVEE